MANPFTILRKEEEAEEGNPFRRLRLEETEVNPFAALRLDEQRSTGDPGTIVGKALKRGVLRTGQSVAGFAQGARRVVPTSIAADALTGLVRGQSLSEVQQAEHEKLQFGIDVLEPGLGTLPSRDYSVPEQIVAGAAEAIPRMVPIIAAFLTPGGQPAALSATFALGFGDAYRDASERPGATEAQKLTGATASGIVEAAGEAIPLGFLKKALKGPLQGSKKFLVEATKKALTQAGAEATTEFGQELLQRVVALATFAQDEEWTPQDWRRAFLAAGSGGLLGLAFGGGVSTLGNLLGDPVAAPVEEPGVGEEVSREALLEVPAPGRGETTLIPDQTPLQPPNALPILKPLSGEAEIAPGAAEVPQDLEARLGQLSSAEEARKAARPMPVAAIGTLFLDPAFTVGRRQSKVSKDTTVQEEPHLAIEELQYVSSVVQGEMLEKTQEVYAPLRRVGVNPHVDFSRWLLLNRVAEGDRQNMDNPGGLTSESAAEEIHEIEERVGVEATQVIRESAKRYNSIRQNRIVRKWVAESRLASPEAMAKMEDNAHYVRVFVQDHINDEKVHRNVGAYLHEQHGTVKAAGNALFETDLGDAILVRGAMINIAVLENRDFLKNHFPEQIVELENPGSPAFIEPILEGKKIIYYREDGDLRAAMMPTDVVNAIHKEQDPVVSKVLSMVTLALKAPMQTVLVERNPAFPFGNFPKDAMAMYLAFQGGPIRDGVDSVRYLLRALPDAFQTVSDKYETTPEIVLDMLSNGEIPPLRTGVFGADRLNANDLLISVLRDSGIELPHQLKTLKDAASFGEKADVLLERAGDAGVRLGEFLDTRKGMNPLRVFSRKPGEFSERVTKIAGHRYVQDHPDLFRSPRHGRHAVRQTFGTPNFMGKTTAGAFLDAWSIFGHVAQRGIAQQIEVYKQSPRRYLTKAMILTGVPTAAAILATKGFMGEPLREAFRRIPSHDKRNRTNIPLAMVGSDNEKKTVYLSLPRAHLQQVIGNALWSSAEPLVPVVARDGAVSYVGEPSDEARKFTENMTRLVFETLPWTDATPILESAIAGFEAMAGKNYRDKYFDRPVFDEDSFEAGLDIPEQYAKYVWGNVGGRVLWNFQNERESTHWIEDLKALPVVGAVMNQFLRVSNAGLFEEYWDEILGPHRANESRKTYVRKEEIRAFLQSGDDENYAELHRRLSVRDAAYRGGVRSVRKRVEFLRTLASSDQEARAKALARGNQEVLRDLEELGALRIE